jgi:hypothetical protein
MLEAIVNNRINKLRAIRRLLGGQEVEQTVNMVELINNYDVEGVRDEIRKQYAMDDKLDVSTVQELRTIASGLMIPSYSRLCRGALITAIRNKRNVYVKKRDCNQSEKRIRPESKASLTGSGLRELFYKD